MKSKEEIKMNLEECEESQKYHLQKGEKFNLKGNINFEKTDAYTQGWINALKYVLRENE